MVGSHRTLRRVLATALVVGLALSWAGVADDTVAAGSKLPAWRGGIDLYRAGTFTTQRSWLWCTAADVQIIRNIVDRQRDHSTSAQRRYFAWMRGRNRYDLPLSAGVDAAGWTAGLRHFVDDRYRLVASRTFDEALRSAVQRLRQTNLPVAITVSRGNHGWVLTGFQATADPAATASFTVTSVRVVGPLYGLQSKGGYDMPPDTKLTPAQLKRFFTTWRYAPRRMIWDGLYVSIQPVPSTQAASKPVAAAPASQAVQTSQAPSVDPANAGPSAQASPTVSLAPVAVVAVATPPAASAGIEAAGSASVAGATGPTRPGRRPVALRRSGSPSSASASPPRSARWRSDNARVVASADGRPPDRDVSPSRPRGGAHRGRVRSRERGRRSRRASGFPRAGRAGRPRRWPSSSPMITAKCA